MPSNVFHSQVLACLLLCHGHSLSVFFSLIVNTLHLKDKYAYHIACKISMPQNRTGISLNWCLRSQVNIDRKLSQWIQLIHNFPS